MSTPVSLKERSFFTLPSARYQGLISDDFVQKKFWTETFKVTSTNNSVVNYKATVDYKFDEKANQDKFSLSDEVKLLFGYRAWHYQFRVNRKGEMRLHADLGHVKLPVVDNQNVYAQLKFTSSFDKFWGRLGSNYYSDNVQAHQRLERHFDGRWGLSHKNICKFGSFTFGVAATLGLNTHLFYKYDAVFIYNHKQFELGLKHTAPKADKAEEQALHAQQPGRFTAGLNYKHDDNTNLALQVRRIFSKEKNVTFNVGASHQVNKDTFLKVKVNQDLKVSTSVKYKLDKSVSVLASATLPLKREGGVFKTNQLIPLPVGVQVDWVI